MKEHGKTRALIRVVPTIAFCLALLLSLGACQMMQKMKKEQKEVNVPISMDMIDVYEQYQLEGVINAPAMKVWDTMTDPRNMTYIFSSFDKIILRQDQPHKLERGMRFGFDTKIAGKEIRGDAVVTDFVPGQFLTFSMLKPRRNVLTLTMQENKKKTKTKVYITITMEAFAVSMAITNFEIRQSINAGIRETISHLRKATLGKVAMDKQQNKAGLEFVQTGLTPFDIIHYVHKLPVSMVKVSEYFLKQGAFAQIAEKMDTKISPNLQHMLELPAVGVPYEAEIGPFDFRGIVLVTEMIPDLTMNLAMIHAGNAVIKGGGNLRFIASGENETELHVLEYFQIPDEYDCKPVDKKALEAGLENKIKELVEVAAWVSTREPHKAIWSWNP